MFGEEIICLVVRWFGNELPVLGIDPNASYGRWSCGKLTVVGFNCCVGECFAFITWTLGSLNFLGMVLLLSSYLRQKTTLGSIFCFFPNCHISLRQKKQPRLCPIKRTFCPLSASVSKFLCPISWWESVKSKNCELQAFIQLRYLALIVLGILCSSCVG